jgi:predicted AAA+ superfamily ATPase
MVDIALYSYMEELLKYTPTAFSRYMLQRIDWNSRLVGIIGPRGIGKSTMILQHIIRNQTDGHHLYVSADNIYFLDHRLATFADEFVKDGGTHLYIDEIHKYKNWSAELKQIYDVHPALHVVFTGSSVIDIRDGEADLSRRALIYSMQGLSFREYLELFHKIESPSFSFAEIISNKAFLPDVEHPLPLFRDYLRRGYYPFSGEGGFEMRLQQVVSQTIESDIPQYADMKASTARKLKQMVAIISRLAPYKPSAENLATEIGVSKNNVPDYLSYLERAEMIGQLRDETGGMRGLGKVEKAYIDNSNLMYALTGGNPDIGNIRETFFYNQMRVENDVMASHDSDFVIGKYTFEVGGKKKGRKQIAAIPNSFVVRDDIEYGADKIIPLWQFGLNY